MRKNIFLLILLLSPICLHAQMSDSRVIDYVKSENEKGTSQQAIGVSLLQRGVSQQQLEKIKRQVEQENQSRGTSSATRRTSSSVLRTNPMDNKSIYKNIDGDSIVVNTDTLQREVFGKNIFKRKNLSFTPELNIPTPANYKLGAGDEVVIDIWGASQATIRETISPEGTISVENIGPLSLGGMTVEQANSYVKQKFSSLYSGVGDNDGTSHIKLTLGQIRTIQINVMGEVNTPGTYSISSLSSIFHALYLAEGINNIGSLREVNLYRGGQKVISVDIYDFLLRGKSSDNIRLFDGDLIIVPPYKSLVNIAGEIKRPMDYEMTENETASDIINYAGGFAGGAYSEQVNLIRKTGGYNKIFTLNTESMASFNLADGDSIIIGRGLDLYENRVKIEGQVFRTGDYEIGKDIKTIKELVQKAGGVKENAFLDRAILTREKEDLTLETLSLNLNDILSNKAPDITLKKNDVLYIASNKVDTDLGNLTILGMVANPGQYKFAANTTIKDLIVIAGGLLSSASTAKVDVSRRIIDPSSTTSSTIIAETFSFSIENGLIADGKDNFVLEPYDQIYVRRSPGYQIQRNVIIEGEVLFPGTYTLKEKELKLSDLIEAAGGLTNNAFAAGARLVRRRSAEDVQRQRESLERISRGEAKDSISMSAMDIEIEYTVGIELDRALASSSTNSKSGDTNADFDMVLKPDDRLIIPEFDNTIKINGAVMFPNTVLYRKGESLNYYIEQAGGFSDIAQKKKAYIVYMNGTTAKAKGSAKGLVKPGCEIIVPSKEQRAPMTLGEKIAIGSSVTSMASVVALLINSLAK